MTPVASRPRATRLGPFPVPVKVPVPVAVATIAVATVVLRLLVLWLSPVELDKDALGYWRLATSLLETGTLTLEGAPTASRLPGYPAFVALVRLVHDAPEAVVVAHALLEGLNVVLISVLARRLAAGATPERADRVARLSAVAWALYPYAFVYAARVITETLTVSLVLMLALAADERRRVKGGRWTEGLAAGGFGLVAAALTYVKPSFLFFVPCWWAYRWLRSPAERRRALSLGAVSLTAFALAYAPWPLRNQRVMGEAILGATNFGQSFFNGAYGLGTLGDPWDYRAAEHGPLGARPEEIAHREALLAGIRGLPEVERNRALGRVALRLVEEEPLRFLRNAALTLPRLWLRFPWETPPTLKGLALSAIQVLWLGASLRGLVRYRQAARAGPTSPVEGSSAAAPARVTRLFIEAVVIYTVGIHLVTTPVVRYSFPAYALLCALIGQNLAPRRS